MINNIFLIAEIGINHNGDIEIAKKLIDNAKKTKFDAVKFQKRTLEKVYSKEILDSLRESPWGTTTREQKEGLEFNLEEYKQINEYCKHKNIEWFASAWDEESVNFLEDLNVKFHKVASAMIIDQKLLKTIAKTKKYTFISTGMSTLKDIENAVEIFEEYKCPFELMHCVSTYPMPPEQANLITIKYLKEKYNCDVGYSGHETGLAVSIAACAFGLSSIERHLTLDRSMYGSDQAASLEIGGFKKLVEYARTVETSIGINSLGIINADEVKIAQKLRAHIKL